MQKSKILNTLFFIFLLLTLLAVIPASAADIISNQSSNDSQISIAPLNPAFVQYQKDLEQKSNQISANTISTSPDFSNKDLSSNRLDIILEQDELTDSSLHPPGLVPSPIDFSYIFL